MRSSHNFSVGRLETCAGVRIALRTPVPTSLSLQNSLELLAAQRLEEILIYHPSRAWNYHRKNVDNTVFLLNNNFQFLLLLENF